MDSHTPRFRIGLAALLLATAAVGPASAQQLRDSTGTYRFQARSGATVIIEGTMTVATDTIIVDAIPGPCYAAVNSSRAGPIVYKCAHVTLVIDRAHPLTKSNASSTRVVIDKTPVCMVNGRDAQGRPICVKTGYESSERDQTISARVRITQLP